jgi:zinc transport system substrate-binding protein
LFELRDSMHASLDRFSGRRIVTFHEAFPYFAREFGFVVTAVIEHEPGTAPSAGELAKTISVIRNAGVKVLFTEPQYPPDIAETIARETGARIFQLDPAVTGPDDPDAYIEIMKKNLEVLKVALQ